MKRYDVIINGFETTLLLSDADAAARGLTAAPEPRQDPESEPEPQKVATKAKTPANKSRSPRNKQQ